MTNSFIFIKKKNELLRPVQNYWELNKGLVKNKYSFPLIPELINKLKGAEIFFKINFYKNIIMSALRKEMSKRRCLRQTVVSLSQQ